MAKLIYPINMSLDGYMEDESGNLEWSISDDETFAFWTDFQRSIGTYLYGRRMYDSMVYWETVNPQATSSFPGGNPSEAIWDFARIWQSANKIVYSRTLQEPLSARTRIDRMFDADAIRQLKESARADITIGGPNLANQAMSLGLIDECHLLVHPILLGGGKRALPDGLHIRMELLDERPFASGVVHLHYRMIV